MSAFEIRERIHIRREGVSIQVAPNARNRGGKGREANSMHACATIRRHNKLSWRNTCACVEADLMCWKATELISFTSTRRFLVIVHLLDSPSSFDLTFASLDRSSESACQRLRDKRHSLERSAEMAQTNPNA